MKVKKLFLTMVVILAALIWLNHALDKRVKWNGLKSDTTHIKQKSESKSPNDFIFWELISRHLLSIAG